MCIHAPITAQVIIDYHELKGDFVKEDIYSFSVINKTDFEVEGLVRGTITAPNEEVIYQFELANLNLEKGTNVFNKDVINLQVLVDNYTKETIREGFRMECALIHPLDKKSVIAKYSTYYIASEVGMLKGNRQNLAKLIREGFQQEEQYEIKFYQPSKSYETRDFVVGIENVFQVRASKFKFPYRWISSDINASNIKVYSDDMGIQVTRNPDGVYKLKIAREKKNIRLKVKVIEDDYYLEKDFFFGLKTLNRPAPYLSDHEGARIASGNLADFEEIKLNFSEEFEDIPYTIVGFNLQIIKASGSRFKHESLTARLEISVQEELKKLETGDILIIDEIKCLYPGRGFPRRLESMIFYID